MIVSSKITLTALKSEGLDVNFTDEGKTEVTFNGETIKNKSTLEPSDGKEFILGKLKELNLLGKPSGGNGGGDDTGDHKEGGYDAFVKEMTKQDIEEGTAKFSEEMNKRIKDKTLVM